MDTSTKETTAPVVKKQETKNYSIPVLFLRQSNGKPSASFTLMFFTFNAILIWLLLSIFEGIGPIKVRPFDAGQAMTLFTPLGALYFGRRFTDAKNQNSGESGEASK